jgi:N,N-dimethylformamidase
VIASDFTWNAYNDFGGRSNYISMDALPAAPTASVSQEDVWYRAAGYLKWDAPQYAPLSFDRPEPYNAPAEEGTITDVIEPLGSEHVAPAEWRLLGWLEREGFSYDLYAESHLAEGAIDLDAYRALVLSTHPEYWARAMFESVRDWVVDRGGGLLYLGGNGLDCEVSIDEGTMTIHNGEARRWMGHFESRFASRGARPGALLGVATTLAGMGTAAPYRVVADGHWAFSGTGLGAGDRFGFSSLDFRNPGGASGHETDKLSADAPPGTVLLARGENPDGGGADMVLIEHASGGRVFSVSSISYPCCLLVDEQVSTVTKNVLTRFTVDGAGP